MKRFLIIALICQLLSNCSNDRLNYSYIKIITVTDADSATSYNKGVGLASYFYYNPNSDAVILRRVESQLEDSNVFRTYEGQFNNHRYTDTIAMLIAFLKQHKKEDLSYVSDGNTYCGPEFLVEYNDAGHSHFVSFILSHDTLNQFCKFFSRLRQKPWDKRIVPNNRINENEEVISALKGLGTYDSITFTPPYIPLPCEKGIKMEMLYGKWRTIGDKYNNANLKYWTNTIGRDGSWIMERFSNNELKSKYLGRIISITKNHLIKVKINDEIANLKILNLTENCFKYENEGSDQTWRLDRMK